MGPGRKAHAWAGGAGAAADESGRHRTCHQDRTMRSLGGDVKGERYNAATACSMRIPPAIRCDMKVGRANST
jgi:hypothetical protein